MKRLFIIILLVIGLALPAQAGLFFRAFTSLIGDVAGSVDHVDCTDVYGTGSATDDGIGYVQTATGENYFYYFDQSDTTATSSPDSIRCKNYSASGVWLLQANIAKKSDCSGITAGICLDTDDGKLYAWDGSSVVGVGTVSISGTPVATDWARFTDASTIEGRSTAEMLADTNLEIGIDVQAYDVDLTTYSGITPSTDVQGWLSAANYTAMKKLINTDDIQTLTGIASGTSNLGTFTGSIVSDTTNIKNALQELETYTETPDLLQLSKLTAAPASPSAGRIYFADETTWDPSGLGIGKAYYVIYDGTNYIALFDEDGAWYVDTIQAASNTITSAIAITLTASQMNSIIVMTGAGDVNIPADQCDTATGIKLGVKTTGTFLNSVTSDDAADIFVLSDGTALDAGDELDLAGNAGSQVAVICLQANKWWVTGEIGTAVDGGVAD